MLLPPLEDTLTSRSLEKVLSALASTLRLSRAENVVLTTLAVTDVSESLRTKAAPMDAESVADIFGILSTRLRTLSDFQ